MAQLPGALQASLARYRHLIGLAEAAAEDEPVPDRLQPTISAFEAENIFREAQGQAIPRPLYRQWGPNFDDILVQGVPVYDPDDAVMANVFVSLLGPEGEPYERADVDDDNEANELLFDNGFPAPLVQNLDPRAVYTIAHNPDLARILSFIIHSSSSSSVFDTVHPQLVSAWNFDHLANILDSRITTDPEREEEAVFALQLLPDSLIKFPNVITALQLLQYPYAIACACLMFASIARYQARRINPAANIQLHIQLSLITQRFLLPAQADQEIENAHIGVRRFSPTAHIPVNASVVETVEVIVDTVRDALFGHNASNSLVAFDKVLVVGVYPQAIVYNAHVNLLNMPAPEQADVPELNNNLHTELFRYLHQLNAFRLPVIEDGLEHYLPPAFTSQPLFDDNLCIISSFVYMKALQAGILTDDRDAMKAKTASCIVRSLRDTFLSRIGEDPQRTNVAWALEKCREIVQENPITELQSVADRPFYLGFLGSPTSIKPPSYPMVRFATDGTLSSCYPQLTYDSSTIPNSTPILVYTYAHVCVMRMGSYRKYCIDMDVTASYHARERVMSVFPEPLTVTRIVMEKKNRLMRENRLKRTRYPVPAFQPFIDDSLFSEEYNTNYFACDFETRICETCNTHEAYCVSLVYGLRPEQQVTFIGRECPLLSTPDYLHEGCLVQLLNWLRVRFGYVRAFTPYSSAAVQRTIQFFNGANFDLYMVLNTLSVMGENFTVLPLNNSILSIRWGNYVFGDFAKLYPSCSLSSLFDTFSRTETHLGRFRPNEGKWECFPYNLIGKVVSCDVDTIDTEEAWGYKCCKEFASLGTVQGNITWWKKYKGQQYNEDILKEYCLSDTQILMYCMAIDFHHLATGKIGNASYNLLSECTVASRSMSLWRQCFQKGSLESPDGLKELSMRYSSGDPFFLHDAFVAAYQGGIVTRRYSQVVSPDIADRVKDYESRTGDRYRIDCYDFNSHYPGVMRDNNMPVQFLGEERYTTPIRLLGDSSSLAPADLYWARIQYPDGQSGIPCKFSGRSMCPTLIPEQYDDPKAPNKERFTFIFGCELAEAVDAGATVTLFSRLRFHSAPIFKDFVTHVYGMRKATNDPVMKLFLKLLLNSQYGKWGEEQKPDTVIINNLSDIEEPSSISSIRRLVKSRFGVQSYMVQFVPKSKHFHGQFTYIAAAVTAFARAKFNKCLRMLESCNSKLGIPARVRYGDTDSFYCCILDDDDPHVQRVKAQLFDMSELGMLKSETDNQGYVDGAILGRKLLALLPAMPMVLASLREQYMDYAKSHPKEWKMTAKGQNKNMVDPLDFMLMSKDSKAFAEYTFPFRFIKTFEKGITPVFNTSRKVRPGDLSRYPPDPNSSFCRPLPRPMNL